MNPLINKSVSHPLFQSVSLGFAASSSQNRFCRSLSGFHDAGYYTLKIAKKDVNYCRYSEFT